VFVLLIAGEEEKKMEGMEGMERMEGMEGIEGMEGMENGTLEPWDQFKRKIEQVSTL
jgi:hypothetical protein